jgi:hypothetical protein
LLLEQDEEIKWADFLSAGAKTSSGFLADFSQIFSGNG